MVKLGENASYAAGPRVWKPERKIKPDEISLEPSAPSSYFSKRYGFIDVSVQSPGVTAPKWIIYTRKDSQLVTRTDDGVYVSYEDGIKIRDKYKIMLEQKKVTLKGLLALIEEAKKVEYHAYKPGKGMVVAVIQKDGQIGLIWRKIIEFKYQTRNQASRDTVIADKTPVSKPKKRG